MKSRLYLRAIRRLLLAAGLALGEFVAGNASAQVRPPGMHDCDGNEYRYPVTTWDAPIVRTWPTKGDDHPTIARKMSSIIIPAVEFHSTPLPDAIEQLRQESYRRDTDPDPITRGVRVILRLPPPPLLANEGLPIPGLPQGSPTKTGSPNERTLITLTLNNIPLLEVLRYVASQAGLRLEIQESAVCLVSIFESIPTLVTAEFRVPPEVFDIPTEANVPHAWDLTSPPMSLRHGNAKMWLEARGVTFPPGAAAVYLPRAAKLVIRNTQENIDHAETLFLPLEPPPMPVPLIDRKAITGIIHEFTFPITPPTATP